MTKAIATIALLAHMVSPCLAQEMNHAPTVSQCRAEQRLWLSKLEQYPPDVAEVSYGDLQYWTLDMVVCANLDAGHEVFYLNTYSMADHERIKRLEGFLHQRTLFYEFLKQDAQDKH